jgi:hypothetical protein
MRFNPSLPLQPPLKPIRSDRSTSTIATVDGLQSEKAHNEFRHFAMRLAWIRKMVHANLASTSFITSIRIIAKRPLAAFPAAKLLGGCWRLAARQPAAELALMSQ